MKHDKNMGNYVIKCYMVLITYRFGVLYEDANHKLTVHHAASHGSCGHTDLEDKDSQTLGQTLEAVSVH